MLGLLLVVLATFGVLALAFTGVAFLEVAFGDPPPSEFEVARAEGRWRPPYVSGPALFEWARSATRGIVRDVLGKGDEASTARELTTQVERGVERALLPDLPTERYRKVPCPVEGQGVIGLTVPEAISLADELRTRLSRKEFAELEENVTLFDEWMENRVATSPCALQGEDHVCKAYASRPLLCRPSLAVTLADRLRAESGMPKSARDFAETHVETVTRGVTQGLQEGLDEAGLDANRYELHSALRRALRRPDAAVAWARGENIFEDCRVIAPPPERKRPRRARRAY